MPAGLSKPDYTVKAHGKEIVFIYQIPSTYTEGKPTGEVIMGKPVYTDGTCTPVQTIIAYLPKEAIPELEDTLRPVVALRITANSAIAKSD